MADIAFLVTLVIFFLACAGYIAVCGRIIGPDQVEELVAADDAVERAA